MATSHRATRRIHWDIPLPALQTVTYGLLVAATLVLVIGLTVRLTHTYLTRELDYHLLATVTAFQEGPARRIQRPEDLMQESRAWLAGHASAPDDVTAIRTSDDIVLSSAGSLDLRQVRGARDLLTADTPTWRILDGPTGRIRIVAVPLTLQGRQIGTLVVAASKDRLNATLRALSVRIVLASVVGLTLAIILGYSAVRRSLRPLAQILQQIEAIQATNDLSRRIGHAGPNDEIGRLAAAFDRMLMRLEGAFRSQQRFVSDASHELRTPLAVAKGHLELLHQQISSAQDQRSLTIAAGELDRMARIVEDLLLLAQLDEGMTLSPQPVDVELVLREALLRSMLLAPRQTGVEAEPGLYASADPGRLLQVLTNLITNAAQHGGDDVTITLVARGDHGRAMITVSDTGPGIPPQELPHVFERFYRGSRARRTPGGVGLGLAIAASLVEAMGGKITVNSTPGSGTTFALTMPLAPAVPSLEPLGANR